MSGLLLLMVHSSLHHDLLFFSPIVFLFSPLLTTGDVKGTIEDPPPSVPSAGPAILLRFDSGPSAEVLCETAQERGYVQLKVRYNQQLSNTQSNASL